MAKDIQPFDESQLLEQLRGMGYEVDAVVDTSVLKDFELTDKNDLVNYPFVIIEVLVKESLKFKGDYVVCRCVDRDGNKIVFADGSTGIKDQIVELLTNYESIRTPINPNDGVGWSGFKYKVAIPVMKGLSKHDYDTKMMNEQTGEVDIVAGETFRLQFK